MYVSATHSTLLLGLSPNSEKSFVTIGIIEKGFIEPSSE
jgi:hypothetical protein